MGERNGSVGLDQIGVGETISCAFVELVQQGVTPEALADVVILPLAPPTCGDIVVSNLLEPLHTSFV